MVPAAPARSLAAAVVASGLAAPAGAQVLRGDGSIACGGSYAIAPGDTLSRVAQRAYGDPMLWDLLVEANRDVLGGDPEQLAVGMSIAIPCVDVSGQRVSAEEAARKRQSIEAVVRAEGPLTPAELDTLFGPVALFPDPVLTQVLVAATFPLDVVKAGRFVEGAESLSDQERAAKAIDQGWDDSVRELAAGFPDLVTRMSDNIDWTEQAGEAVVAQTDEVLAALQRLRAKAQENGYLVDNQAQTVEAVNDKIVIAPATPGVVYVPTYDSKVVYTTPVAGPPVYHYGYDDVAYVDDDDWGDALVAGGIILGGAVVLDEIFDDDDWDGWDGDDDIDWDGGDITIDRDEVNIDVDRDDIAIGDGERRRIGDGERVSIGDSDRTQIDRGEFPGHRRAAGRRAAPGPAGRASISDPASREVARQKIETRKQAGGAPADLRATRPPSASNSRSLAQSRSSDRPSISRPATSQRAAARAPSRSSAFNKPSRSRPAASSNRGRASAGRRRRAWRRWRQRR